MRSLLTIADLGSDALAEILSLSERSDLGKPGEEAGVAGVPDAMTGPEQREAGPQRAVHVEELAARKLLALFDRAEARDFVDVHTLSERLNLDDLLGLASDLDQGFSAALLAEMLTSHRRFIDDEIVALGGDPYRLRAWADEWLNHLVDNG